MSKRSSSVKRTPTTYNISDDVLAKIGVLTYDPSFGRAKYGQKSLLVEELLELFFRAHISNQDVIDISKISKKLRG